MIIKRKTNYKRFSKKRSNRRNTRRKNTRSRRRNTRSRRRNTRRRNTRSRRRNTRRRTRRNLNYKRMRYQRGGMEGAPPESTQGTPGEIEISEDTINQFLTDYDVHLVRHGHSCGNLMIGTSATEMSGSPTRLQRGIVKAAQGFKGKITYDPYLSSVGKRLSDDICPEQESESEPEPEPEIKLCDSESSYYFASSLMRAQETCVRMFNPRELVILPFCKESGMGNDNSPDPKIWKNSVRVELERRLKEALSTECEIDASLFFDHKRFTDSDGLNPYKMANSEPDIMKLFSGLMGYVEHKEIPDRSKLFIVTHSHFMKNLGLYEPGTETSTQDKPLNNSVYLVKSFNLGTGKIESSQLIFQGFNSDRIEGLIGNPMMYGENVSGCKRDMEYRKSIS